MARWTFFLRRQNNRRTGETFFAELELPATLDLQGAIEAALAAGLPKGDRYSGIVEVQNDGDGIWEATDGNRLWSPTKSGPKVRGAVQFTSWDE